MFRLTESFPASSTNGMISNDGNEVSICISKSVAWPKMRCSRPRIGDTASPGNDTTIDTDQIASSVVSAIVPFPV